MNRFEVCGAPDAAPTYNISAHEVWIVNGRVVDSNNAQPPAETRCSCDSLPAREPRYVRSAEMYRPDSRAQIGYQSYSPDMGDGRNFYSIPATINVFRTQSGWTLQIDLSGLDNMRWNPGRQLSDSLSVGRPQFMPPDQIRGPGFNQQGIYFDRQTQRWYSAPGQIEHNPNDRSGQYFDPKTQQWYRIPPDGRRQTHQFQTNRWYDPQTQQWYQAEPRQRTVQPPLTYEQWLYQQQLEQQRNQKGSRRMEVPTGPAPMGRARYGVDPRTGALLAERDRQMRRDVEQWEADVLGEQQRWQGGRRWEDPLDFDPTRKKVGESVGQYLRKYGPDQKPRPGHPGAQPRSNGFNWRSLGDMFSW